MKAELTIRVVAFIDILGFSEIIKRISGEAEPELFKLIDLTFSEIERRRNKIDSSNQQPEKMTAFSDCFVISTIPERYDYLIDLIALMTRRLLINGILLRGGITMGKLFHDSDRVFGEGLISAYNLENKAAVYPRILIDLPEEMQWSPNFSLLNTPCKYNVFGYKSGNVNGSKIREDSDGGCIINIFSPYFSCRLGPSKGYMLRVTECSDETILDHVSELRDGSFLKYIDEYGCFLAIAKYQILNGLKLTKPKIRDHLKWNWLRIALNREIQKLAGYMETPTVSKLNYV